MISTGSQGSKLWVLPRSHTFIFMTKSAAEDTAKGMPLEIIEIPPWSTILCRGELIHTGAGGGEDEANGLLCIRLHDYILRRSIAFADQIFDQPIWKLA